MCEPCTSRVCARAGRPTQRERTSSTQGPAALTRAFACAVLRLPEMTSRNCMVQTPDDLSARSTCVRQQISAPRSAGRGGVGNARRRCAAGETEISKPRPNLAGGGGSPGGVGCQIGGGGAGKPLATADVIIEKETEPQHPCGPQTLAVRQHETE